MADDACRESAIRVVLGFAGIVLYGNNIEAVDHTPLTNQKP
jgi:hypothetical protein